MSILRFRVPLPGMLLAAAAATASPAHAYMICVSNSTDLRNATIVANAPGTGAEEIRIRRGHYLPPASPPASAAIDVAPGAPLSISGGWIDAACTQQDPDARTTLLDGGGDMRVMTIYAAVDVTIANLSFRNGREQYAGCMTATGSETLALDNVIFDGCEASAASGAFSVSDLAAFTARGVLAINNLAPDGAVAKIAVPDGGYARISQSTFADNYSSSSGGAVLYILGAGAAYLSNDLLLRNGSTPAAGTWDLVVATEAVNNLSYSAYERAQWTPDTLRSGNIEVVSGNLFMGFGDYRTRPNSPARNGGTNTPFGGALAHDVFGNPRILEHTMDMGAVESDALFTSGFD